MALSISWGAFMELIEIYQTANTKHGHYYGTGGWNVADIPSKSLTNSKGA